MTVFANMSPNIYGNVHLRLFPNAVCWVHVIALTENSRLKSIYWKSSWLSVAVDDTLVIDGFHDSRYYLEIIHFSQT